MPDSHSPQPDQPNERLESYLDGLLTPDERAVFEKELAADPQLRRECELQGKIDASLGKMFAAPDPPADILALADREITSDEPSELPNRNQDETKKRRRTVLMVLAASLVWVVVGLKVYRQSTDDGYRELALADIYQKCVDRGFRPKWVCEDDRQFAETFQRRQGIPLLLKPEAQEAMVGLSYLKGIAELTTTMLARVEGQPILVFVDNLQNDPQPQKPSWWSGLKLFRQELGGLVLYEITPLAEPRVLSSFYIPEMTDLPKSDTEQTGSQAETSRNSP